MSRSSYGEKAWSFETARFEVALYIEPAYYETWGDDETDDGIRSGRLVCFDSTVVVSLDGEEIAADNLGQSVYEDGNVKAFWTDHRDPDPMNRNCTIMRAARGENAVVCHYFPSMVRQAISEARAALRNVPYIRQPNPQQHQ
jgi:hypothetical protein